MRGSPDDVVVMRLRKPFNASRMGAGRLLGDSDGARPAMKKCGNVTKRGNATGVPWSQQLTARFAPLPPMSTRTSSSSADFLSAIARSHGVTAVVGADGRMQLTVPDGVCLAEPVILAHASHIDVDVRVGRDASVNVVIVIPPGKGASRVDQRAQVAHGGVIHWQTVVLGGNVEHSIVSILEGGGARSTADVVFYAHGTDRQNISVRNIFQAENGGGQITIKGVAEHKAHVRCDGMIDIGLQGRGTDTFLSEEVLMLDPTARVDAVPGLEIKTNDVKASHSAVVSRLSPEDLFYFASRGIGQKEARAMFVEGFLGEIVSRIADDKTRVHVEGLIRAKYAHVKDS